MSVEEKIADIFGVDRRIVEKYCNEYQALDVYIERKLEGKNLLALTPDKRRAMYAIVKLLKPHSSVETGVGPGSSTTVILSSIGNGFLHSIDFGVKYGHEPETYPVGFVIPEELKKKWQLHTGDSAKLLKPLLEKLGKIEMFYHDSTHEEKHVEFEISNAWEHMDRGVILVDNYQWTDAPGKLVRRAGSTLTELSGRAGGFCIIPKNIRG